MFSDNQQIIFCADDDEYRVYCAICETLCIERFYKNLLESKTHINNIRKKQHLKKAFQKISQYQIWISFVNNVIDRLSKMNLNSTKF